MSKLLLSALIVAVALTGAPAALANPHKYFNPHRGIPNPHKHHHHHRHHHHRHHHGGTHDNRR